jgi:hypothetical protein
MIISADLAVAAEGSTPLVVVLLAAADQARLTRRGAAAERQQLPVHRRPSRVAVADAARLAAGICCASRALGTPLETLSPDSEPPRWPSIARAGRLGRYSLCHNEQTQQACAAAGQHRPSKQGANHGGLHSAADPGVLTAPMVLISTPLRTAVV